MTNTTQAEHAHDDHDHDHYCGDCGAGTVPVIVNTGIGPYEYWGYKCFDKREEVVSECCNAELYDDPALHMESNISPREFRENEWAAAEDTYYDPYLDVS